MATAITRSGSKWNIFIRRDGWPSFGANGLPSKQAAIDALVEEVASMDNRMCVIMCVDNTLLVVRKAYGSWQYDIIRNHDSRGSCIVGGTYDDAVDYATQHANSSYLGVSYSATR